MADMTNDEAARVLGALMRWAVSDKEHEALRLAIAALQPWRPIAWRGMNYLGEVVTDWIDGDVPVKLYDLCGNEAHYASVEIAYAPLPPPPEAKP